MERQPERGAWRPWRLSLDDLAGQWTLWRRVDHADGTAAALDGTCRFEADRGGLRQTEIGTLRVGSSALEARQVQLWRPGPRVLFADGRAFHAVGEGRRPAARHLCGADLYEVTYDFAELPDGRWAVEWRVRGPRKDYVLRSRYHRVAACGPDRRGASKGSG